MIKLKNTEGASFLLLKTKAKDFMVYGKRKEIAAALKYEHGSLPVYPNGENYTLVNVGTSYKNGVLRLGCHRFDRKTSRVIVHWAKAK